MAQSYVGVEPGRRADAVVVALAAAPAVALVAAGQPVALVLAPHVLVPRVHLNRRQKPGS